MELQDQLQALDILLVEVALVKMLTTLIMVHKEPVEPVVVEQEECLVLQEHLQIQQPLLV